MRVAIFTDNDFAKINGVTTALTAVLRFMPDSVQPRVYTAADAGLDTASYCAVRSIGIGLPWYREMRVYAPRLRRFARELRRQAVDVVHVTTPGPVGLAARWLAAELRVPLVGSYHTELGEYAAVLSGSMRLGRVLERYVRWYYHGCQAVLVPSEATREVLVARGYDPDRLRIWGRGVDLQRFAPHRASAAWRRAWQAASASCPVILYVGRLSREKGLALVGPVRRRLLRHGLAHRFVFAGTGPMRRELEELCPDGIFLGPLPHDQVGAVMASSDLFFFPSATDTLGNVILEAQASGLPVLVSDRGGPHQHMRPGDTGLVCPAGDADAFASAAIALLTTPRRRQQMSRAARVFAESRDWPSSLTPLIETWRTAACGRAQDLAVARYPDRQAEVLPREVTR